MRIQGFTKLAQQHRTTRRQRAIERVVMKAPTPALRNELLSLQGR